MASTFGETFGALIREKRGQEGLTQRELAIKAFDDGSKVRRIIDLENGTVRRPHIKTVDPLVAYFGITREELNQCKQHGLFSEREQAGVGLSRALMENLALRFEYDNPDAPDEELFAYLKSKAEELKRLRGRLASLEGTTVSLNNQIAAANDALELGRFEEADEILAAAEEVQQEGRTLKEIARQSNIRFARGDAALFSGKSADAASHYLKAAVYFEHFDKEEAAIRLEQAAGQIYEMERRSRSPNLLHAIDLAQRALNATTTVDEKSATWAQRKYQLALLQQTAARMQDPTSRDFSLLDRAIANAQEALTYEGPDVDEINRVYCLMVLGNSFAARSAASAQSESDLDAAISTFQDIIHNPRYENLSFSRGMIFNNISLAYGKKTRRASDTARQDFAEKAKNALFRAIELASAEGDIEAWSAAQTNLGFALADEAAIVDPQPAAFLRIQAIAAFQASLEAYPKTAFDLQTAHTLMALGRILLELAQRSNPATKEAYLGRSIEVNEGAIHILSKEDHPEQWSHARFCIGLAFYLHAEISSTEVAIADCEAAISHFDAANPAYRAAGMEKDLEKLLAADKETKARLLALRQASQPSAATQTPE